MMVDVDAAARHAGRLQAGGARNHRGREGGQHARQKGAAFEFGHGGRILPHVPECGMSEATPLATAPAHLGKHRLEALSDGIFAVAMTLLVIDLRVPEHAVSQSSDLASSLVMLTPRFVAWIISFFVLGIFWFTHHRLFHGVRLVSGGFVWLNIVYLGCVSLMPFSSALAGQYSRLLLAQVFYSGNMILLSGAGLALHRYAHRRPELWAQPFAPGFYRGARFRSLGLMGVALTAVGLTALVPGAGNAAFVLMAPISILSRRVER